MKLKTATVLALVGVGLEVLQRVLHLVGSALIPTLFSSWFSGLSSSTMGIYYVVLGIICQVLGLVGYVFLGVFLFTLWSRQK